MRATDRQGAVAECQGVAIARMLPSCMAPTPLTKQAAFERKGRGHQRSGDTPNRHDVLTGSQRTAPLLPSPTTDLQNWTSSTQGSAIVGHSDRTGLDESAPAKSWNKLASFARPDGRLLASRLRSTGGDGLLYCFAVNLDTQRTTECSTSYPRLVGGNFF